MSSQKYNIYLLIINFNYEFGKNKKQKPRKKTLLLYIRQV